MVQAYRTICHWKEIGRFDIDSQGGLGIVSACALQKTGERSFELTKMGAWESAPGLKAGEFLLEAMIACAQELGAEPLYLLSNAKCAAAIHLYQKHGFAHAAGIMVE